MVKKHNSNIVLKTFLSAIVVFFASHAVIFAQEAAPMNLTFSPVTVSLDTDPGVPVTTQIKIRNNSEKAEVLSTSWGSFIADETGEKPILLEPSEQQDFLQWLSVDSPTITVNPGEWSTVNVTFSPPATAALSYYYTIYFRRAEQQTEPGKTQIQGSPAVLVLTMVNSPSAKRQMELSDFKVHSPFSEYLPQTFSVTVKNTGNVHVQPAGNIFIDGQGKKDLAVLSINPNAGSVLPQSSRTFDVTWDDGFPIAISDNNEPIDTNIPRLFSLEWNLTKADRFRLGNYTAHLLMVYDNGERDVPIESYASFWIIPWKLLLIGVAVGSFALIGILSTTKKIWQKFH
jgi:hypothetical protein